MREAKVLLVILFTVLTPLWGKTLKLSLEDAIRIALKNNHRIKSVEKMVEARKKEKYSSKTDFFPKFSASYSYTHFKDQPIAIFHYKTPTGEERPVSTPIGERDAYQWEVRLTQPVFTGFALYSKYKLSSLGLDVEKVERELAKLDTIRNVKVFYYKALYDKDMLLSAKEEVNYLKAHARDAENLYREGVIPLNDLLKSKVALSASIQREAERESQFKISLSNLAKVMGININTPILLESAVKNIPPPPRSLEPLIQEALQKRPELKELRLKLKMAKYRIKLAKSNYYPKAYFIAGYRHTGYNDWKAVKNKYRRSRETYLGFRINWDFFQWGKTRAEVKSEVFKREALFETLRDMEGVVSLDVKRAFLNLKVAWKNIETARKALSQAKENYRITDIQYKNSLTTSTEVLDARSYLTEAEANYYGALYGYMIALAELERSMGIKKLKLSPDRSKH